LRLLHHYSTSTYETFSEKDVSKNHNKIQIPKVAMSHPFLLDSILAVGALHLEHLGDKPGKFWLRTGLDYHQKSLASFTAAVTNINSQNCEAVAICSMFTIVITLAVQAVSSESPSDLSGILGLRGLLEGIMNILRDWRDYLLQGEFKEYFRPMLDPKLWGISTSINVKAEL
jgi:hypothetical protein